MTAWEIIGLVITIVLLVSWVVMLIIRKKHTTRMGKWEFFNYDGPEFPFILPIIGLFVFIIYNMFTCRK